MTYACSSLRRDFGLHKMVPVKFHQPDPYIPSEETMDLLTTYKQDFNYLPVCQVGLIKPRDTKFPNDKIQYLPTYKGERKTEERMMGQPVDPPGNGSICITLGQRSTNHFLPARSSSQPISVQMES